MKILVLLVALIGCTRKYHKYPYLNKSEFRASEVTESNAPDARPPRMISGKKEIEKFCQGQILFNKNAHEIARHSIPALVRQSCPGSEYLLNAQISHTWWTTLIYTRSCVEVESHCPKRR